MNPVFVFLDLILFFMFFFWFSLNFDVQLSSKNNFYKND